MPEPLWRWAPFVRSQEAIRLTRLCQRSGRAFPRFSNDEVTQFCIEEACFERAALVERLTARAEAGTFAETVDEPALSPEHEDALEKARAFARTGSAA